MSVQAVVPFTINGEKYFTHTSWFSERQYNGWTYIPAENSNLAFYYSLSVVSLACIFFRKTALVRTAFSSYGKIFVGVGGALALNYGGWLAILRSQEGSEIDRLVSKNECGSTPLWKNESQVVNLRDKDYSTFMSRRDGRKYKASDVANYKPDSVLLGSLDNNTIEKLV